MKEPAHSHSEEYVDPKHCSGPDHTPVQSPAAMDAERCWTDG